MVGCGVMANGQPLYRSGQPAHSCPKWLTPTASALITNLHNLRFHTFYHIFFYIPPAFIGGLA